MIHPAVIMKNVYKLNLLGQKLQVITVLNSFLTCFFLETFGLAIVAGLERWGGGE